MSGVKVLGLPAQRGGKLGCSRGWDTQILPTGHRGTELSFDNPELPAYTEGSLATAPPGGLTPA